VNCDEVRRIAVSITKLPELPLPEHPQTTIPEVSCRVMPKAKPQN
jgi:hypothetical protein